MPHFIIFDTEYTTWKDAEKRNWGNENEYREIVQIGALKINREDLSVTEEFNVLIKPARNPILSDYFIDLTKITQEQVDREGIAFIDAYHRFIDFCGTDLVFSYGGDEVMLAENIGLEYGTSNKFRNGRMSYSDIRFYIHRAEPESSAYNSGRLWKYFSLPKPYEADEHDALFDCYSLLAAMRHLIGRGINLPI
jgi:DNA polymerase III epsilon subunit-like protein